MLALLKRTKLIQKKVKWNKMEEAHRSLLQTETDTDTDRSYTAGLRRFGTRSRAELSGESIPYLVRLDLDLDLDLDLGCMRCVGILVREYKRGTSICLG